MSTNLELLKIGPKICIDSRIDTWIARWKAQTSSETPGKFLSHVGLSHHDARRGQAPRDEAQLLLTQRQLAGDIICCSNPVGSWELSPSFSPRPCQFWHIIAWNAGTPQWMVYTCLYGKIPSINGWFRGAPILGNLHIPSCTSKSTLSFKGPEGARASALALGFTACSWGSQFQCLLTMVLNPRTKAGCQTGFDGMTFFPHATICSSDISTMEVS